ncbi:hypothetical protein VN97_g8501 [Penicillium thymicola]|uniref:Uncharacterized protein n=1 Tax=Penicillium thymicola TaxID=293382 RepID=A0AAI9TCM4_PENTH|nr:hypothetical protein VN97_g8501 [Penicillium thymicola]
MRGNCCTLAQLPRYALYTIILVFDHLNSKIIDNNTSHLECAGKRDIKASLIRLRRGIAARVTFGFHTYNGALMP